MAQTASVETEEPLFDTAHGALVFAFNFSGQSFDRPLMNRMAAPAIGTGKGLVGLDGAAQAGFIRAEVASLGKLAEAILISRIAPRTTPCSCRSACCGGHRPNKEWQDAIAYLADYVRNTALAGCTAHGILRREYVTRYFTPKDHRTTIERIAEKYDVDRNTVSAHCSRVAALLGGTAAKKGQDPLPGLEQIATAAAEDRLRAAGMIR